MAFSLNSVVGFNPTKLRAKLRCVGSFGIGCSVLKITHFLSPSEIITSRGLGGKRRGLSLFVADGDRVATDTSYMDSGNSERSIADDSSLGGNLPSLDSSTRNSQFQTSASTESEPETLDVSNGSTISAELKRKTSPAESKSVSKRSPLTAKEKLRAARVLSRYTESKASKPELGSKVLEALKESDRGKRKSGLPEAPTNLFDDSKRGLPKQGLTFEFPGGVDVFIIVFSFVFISTVMFATTYLVWKVGAIHFNEY